MHILENVDLRLYSTMRLGGKTRYLAESRSKDELKQLVDWAQNQKLKFMAIGEGSNIVWRDEGFEGLIIVNKIPGLEFDEMSGSEVIVKTGAGVKWDDVVAQSVSKGLTGIEFLSAIPGTAGAAPVPTAAEILQTAQAQAQTGTVSAEIALMLLDLQGERGVYADPKNLDELRTSLTRKLREHKTLRAFPMSEDVQPLLQFKR